MKNELILEIGTEEIPALYLEESSNNLKDNLDKELKANLLSFNDIETFYTPRRLTAHIINLSPKQENQIVENYGPPKNIAFDENGSPTKAATGFAKSQGIDIKDLEIVKRDRGEFIAARKKIKGKEAKVILEDIIPPIIKSIQFRKSMRWGIGKTTFARPIRWIMCVYDGKTIKFQIEEVKSSSESYGHRFTSNKTFKPENWSKYISGLEERDVILDHAKRRKHIEKEISKFADKLGGLIEKDEELLDTVVNLVEYPVVLYGNFEKKFLDLPQEVLISVMKNHQKYFPIYSKSKEKLLPYFMFVSGTPIKNSEIVIKGNEKVIRARFTDAEFFFNEDTSSPLIDSVKNLKQMVFLSNVGNYFDKTLRIDQLANYISDSLNFHHSKINLRRAAMLSKADLSSQMVFELPELQGTMGKYYALNSGEKKEVGLAIEEHYMPTARDSKLPESDLGSLLSIVDKIDNICACYSTGLKPTGSSDPYALRRQAIGIIQILINQQFGLDLNNVINFALENINPSMKKVLKNKVKEEILDFLAERFKNLMITEGYKYDTVDAVISSNFNNIIDCYERIKALEEFREQKDFDELAIAFKRVVNIAKTKPSSKLSSKLFQDKSETDLHKAFLDIKEKTNKHLLDKSGLTKESDYLKALNSIKTLKTPIDSFFDSVLVMEKDEKLKNNRLALLNEIKDLFFQISDFSKI